MLNGTATVTYQVRNGNPQITNITGYTATDGTAPEPTEVAASSWNTSIATVLSQYFKVTGATITKESGKYYVELGDEKVQLYGQGEANPITVKSLDVTYTIVGFPTLYNTTSELQIFVQPAPEQAVVTVPTFNPSTSNVIAGRKVEIVCPEDAAGVQYSYDQETWLDYDNTTVIEITEDNLNAFFSENPEQIIELMTHIGKRVQSMTKDYDDAKALLKQLNGAEEGKKKSLFSKIKKHIDAYQSNKNQLTDVKADPYGEKFESLKSDRTGKTETFTAGKIFFKEGESEFRKCMYILKSGSVGLYKNYRKSDEEKTSEMNALSIFGEIGMITFTPRSYTAVTESDETVVEIIYREDLEDIFRENPLKIELILRHLSNRLRCITIDFLKVCKEITEKHGN